MNIKVESFIIDKNRPHASFLRRIQFGKLASNFEYTQKIENHQLDETQKKYANLKVKNRTGSKKSISNDFPFIVRASYGMFLQRFTHQFSRNSHHISAFILFLSFLIFKLIKSNRLN